MTEFAQIRTLVETDLPMVLSWRNHPSVRQAMFSGGKIEPDEHHAWFERLRRDPTRRITIVEKNGIAFGFVQFSDVAVGGVAEWGFYLRPDADKGSGQMLGLAALDYAFSDLMLHKVYAQTLSSNTRSSRFHKRMGFKKEGLLRAQHQCDDKYEDVICFGLFQREWKDVRTRLTKGDVVGGCGETI